MEIEVIERAARQHRDLVDDQSFATSHPVEGGPHVGFSIHGELGEVAPEILPFGGSEQHAAPAVDGHAADVEGRHPGRGRDMRFWMTFEIVPHVVTFPGPCRASEKHVLTSVGEVAELVGRTPCNHTRAHGSHAPPSRITQPAIRPRRNEITIIGQRRRGRFGRCVNPWTGKRQYADCG